MTNTVPDQVGAALEIHSLRKTYPGDVVALDGLDLSVSSGTIFGLLGPNGAGKTTAVKILATLSRPDDGSASVAGVDVLTEPQHVRQLAGYVSQRSGADVQATGTDNMVLQGRIHGLDRHTARAVSGRLMNRFGLARSADRVVKTWSGGMRRRLDIALAMIHTPQVLFLDEPTTGLDPEVRADLWSEIRRLRDQDGVTVLLTTHYLEEADQLADQLAIIDRGRIVAEGTPTQLKDEMRGDGLHIELATKQDALDAVITLDQLPGMWGVVVDERGVHARTERGAEAVPRVLADLDRAGCRVLAVTVSRPSLDDVFLRHAGHGYVPTDTEAHS